MLTIFIVAIALGLVVRFLAGRMTRSARRSDAAAALAVLSFALGVATLAYVGYKTVLPPAPGTAPSNTVATVQATPAPAAPPSLSWRGTKLPVQTTPALLAFLDALTTEPNAPPEAGNVFAGARTLYARGWAATPDKSPTHDLLLVLDDHTVIDGTTHYGRQRTDVADAYQDPALMNTGFEGVAIPVGKLAPGSHTLRIAAITEDGKHLLVGSSLTTFMLNK
jgi:hypothetical protein